MQGTPSSIISTGRLAHGSAPMAKVCSPGERIWIMDVESGVRYTTQKQLEADGACLDTVEGSFSASLKTNLVVLLWCVENWLPISISSRSVLWCPSCFRVDHSDRGLVSCQEEADQEISS